MTDEEVHRLQSMATASSGQRRDSRQIMAAEVLRLGDEFVRLADEVHEDRLCLAKLIEQVSGKEQE